MKLSPDSFSRTHNTDPQVMTAGKGARLRVLPAIISAAGASVILSGCTGVSAGLLPARAVQATATACRCNCYPYGSYPHTTPSATPTPTGTWSTPTRTPRPTKTRPPAGCDYCTMPPAPTQEPPYWPPPIVTCIPRQDEPTITAVPTAPQPYSLPFHQTHHYLPLLAAQLRSPLAAWKARHCLEA